MIQRKPGALRNGAPFAELPEAFKRLQQHLFKQPGGDRGMVILALALHHGEDAVLCAVELALSDGAPTKTHVLNLLHRLIDGKSTAAEIINAPAGLGLGPGATCRRRTLRCPTRKATGGPPCVMIRPGRRLSSCCAA